MSQSLPTFVDYLEAFNRKERFFVVAAATGAVHGDKAAFQLSQAFRDELGRAVGFQIPGHAFGFMDYHLDWLHAAAALTKRGAGWPDGALSQPPPVPGKPHVDTISTGNQEDIDLIVAFEQNGVVEVILVEAKAETGWTNSQLNSKAPRLAAIFGADGSSVPGVRPTFCLWSPKDTIGLNYADWPAWCRADGKHAWMELRVPEGRRQVFGCDETGRPSRLRAYWSVSPPSQSVVSKD